MKLSRSVTYKKRGKMAYFEEILFDKFREICMENRNKWMSRKEFGEKANLSQDQAYYAFKLILENFSDLVEEIKPGRKYYYRLKINEEI